MLSPTRLLLTLALYLTSPCVGAAIQNISPDEWDALNKTLHGHLHVAAPFARPCFPEAAEGISGLPDATSCSQVMQNYGDPGARRAVFGAYMQTQWEACQATSEQCMLNFLDVRDPAAFTPPQKCAQGSVPPYYIDIQGPEDAQAAFNFSKANSVPLVIKSSGHDYSGRSSAPNSLGLWTQNLQDISYDPSFVPTGCSASDPGRAAITFGASVTVDTLYQFAEIHNVSVPASTELSLSVGGGFLQGGGHGILANAVGLAADRALEFKVVVPTGSYLTANACQNTDLFFALRGGGGGTFGVVLEATMSALPNVAFPVVLVELTNMTATMQTQWLQFMADNALQYAQTGWGGYLSLDAGTIYANPLISISQAALEMASMQDFVTNTLNGTFSLSLQASYLTFANNFKSLLNAVPVGLPLATSSRLVPVDNFKTAAKRAQLVKTIVDAEESALSKFVFAVTPYYYKGDGLSSVTPAWRNSLWHVPISAAWNFDTTKAEVQAIYASLSSAMDPLRAITPGSGAYQSEADVYEPDFEASFWGSNYDKLVAIKRKYDPDHLLDCWKCGRSPDTSCLSSRRLAHISIPLQSIHGVLPQSNSRATCDSNMHDLTGERIPTWATVVLHTLYSIPPTGSADPCPSAHQSSAKYPRQVICCRMSPRPRECAPPESRIQQ
ncbi:hypothetical protein C8Q80DRAFT_1101175 [Daedaleopsis nitida]|nr:hypothetical protein C8Q80DRAFT_1101175 [Daedaleopsis nitida]